LHIIPPLLSCNLQRRPVHRKDKFRGEVSVVIDRFKRVEHDLPIVGSLTRWFPVVVRHVEIHQAAAHISNGPHRIFLFYVDMKRVQNDAEVVADLLPQAEGLIVAVYQIGLESIQRLDTSLNAVLLSADGDLLLAYYMLSTSLSWGVH